MHFILRSEEVKLTQHLHEHQGRKKGVVFEVHLNEYSQTIEYYVLFLRSFK